MSLTTNLLLLKYRKSLIIVKGIFLLFLKGITKMCHLPVEKAGIVDNLKYAQILIWILIVPHAKNSVINNVQMFQ